MENITSSNLECRKQFENLKDVDIDRLRRLFLSIDANGRARASIYDLSAILNDPSLQLSEESVSEIITDFLTNHDDGQNMDIFNFLNMIDVENGSANQNFKELIHKAIIRQSAIRKEFIKWDRDGVGFIYSSEFRIVLKKHQVNLTEKEINAMIKFADFDSNGKIHYDEIAFLLTNQYT